jgi:hypothetical protein
LKIGQLHFGVVPTGCLITCIVAITVVAPTSSPPTDAVATPTPAHAWRDEPAMNEQAWQNLLAQVRESARDHVHAAKVIFGQDCAEMEPSVRAAFQATCS